MVGVKPFCLHRVYLKSGTISVWKGGASVRVLLCLAILFLMIQPSKTQALSCAYSSPEEAYQNYDAIIVGSVKQVDSEENVNHVQITVTNSYKGMTPKELTILENATWGSAWGPSVAGETYLFYLIHTENGWENSLCSPSRRLIDAQDDLAFLNKQLPINDASRWYYYAAIGSVILIVLVAAGRRWTRRRGT